MQKLLTPKEIAKRWQCSLRFVMNLIAQGELPSVKIGRLRRISEDQLIEFESERALAR